MYCGRSLTGLIVIREELCGTGLRIDRDESGQVGYLGE